MAEDTRQDAPPGNGFEESGAARGQSAPDGEAHAPDKDAVTIRLEAFEGPLDLLLHLIKREEVDIWNIPIARITEQYLRHLEMMKDLNINTAGDWLVMAATLIFIKSRMLLPPEPVTEGASPEEADPRAELVYQLLEHQKFKNAAHMLYEREEIENAAWNHPPPEVLDEEKGLVSVTLFDLLRAFHEVVKRFESQPTLEFSNEETTVEQKIGDIRRMLLAQDTVLFTGFFAHAPTKHHLIVTFLALLELVRLREVWLYQKKSFDEIFISRAKTEIEDE